LLPLVGERCAKRRRKKKMDPPRGGGEKKPPASPGVILTVKYLYPRRTAKETIWMGSPLRKRRKTLPSYKLGKKEEPQEVIGKHFP